MLVQVRDVPDETVAALKARAKEQGITMAALIRAELEGIAHRPTNAEVLARIERNRPRHGPTQQQTVDEIRRLRDSS